ncbi:hypothetical protein ACFV9E_09095 [Streptomyces sp. NPDC059835]|uniref:hypothetical protein n=1 Tax=Streptomyces sp. NPDC059835 TaxID=3346967 RepID=UPI003646CBCD
MAAVDSEWDYATYAPDGQRCTACLKPIGAMDVVRRGTLEQASGPPVLVYRHADKCPGGE